MNREELFYATCKKVGAVKLPSLDHNGEIWTVMGLRAGQVRFRPPYDLSFVGGLYDLETLDAMQDFTKAMRDIKADEERTLEFNANSPHDSDEAKEVWLAAAEFYTRKPVESDDED
jgi:hypothetical protein